MLVLKETGTRVWWRWELLLASAGYSADRCSESWLSRALLPSSLPSGPAASGLRLWVSMAKHKWSSTTRVESEHTHAWACTHGRVHILFSLQTSACCCPKRAVIGGSRTLGERGKRACGWWEWWVVSASSFPNLLEALAFQWSILEGKETWVLFTGQKGELEFILTRA